MNTEELREMLFRLPCEADEISDIQWLKDYRGKITIALQSHLRFLELLEEKEIYVMEDDGKYKPRDLTTEELLQRIMGDEN